MKASGFYFAILLGLIVKVNVYSQIQAVPRVGEPFPDFIFEVNDFKKDKVKLDDFKGKWLVINFWSLGCTSCFTSFRNIKEIQTSYGDRIEFLLVAKDDERLYGNTEKIYHRISTNMQLKVPAAFDTLDRTSWGIKAYPHMFIITPQGILYAITDGRDLSVEKIKKLIAGDDVHFYPLMVERELDNNTLYTDENVQYLSLIKKSEGKHQETDVDLADVRSGELRDNWSVFNVPLYGLYNYAYFGKWLWTIHDPIYGAVSAYPVLQMRDTTLFSFDFKAFPSRGTYDCVIKLPLHQATSEILMSELRESLRQSFGYNVTVETRTMPVWKLKADARTAKALRSTGQSQYESGGSRAGGFVLKNQSMKRLLTLLTLNFPNDAKIPFLDCTGITGNIDFSIEADMTDMKDVQRHLDQYGLSLIMSSAPMKVLVLSDSTTAD